ncbi:hypothetical protein cypCar_00040034, partial [Cyprinus carpio]
EKHRQALLVKRQTQELLSERESRRRLESEVEALCSQERELKGKAERLEAALYKELQSQNWRNVSRSPVSSCILQTHLPLAQHNVNGLMEIMQYVLEQDRHAVPALFVQQDADDDDVELAVFENLILFFCSSSEMKKLHMGDE